MWTEAAIADSQSGFTTSMDHVAQAFEALGALILVIGVFWSLTLAVITWRRTRSPGLAYATIRQAFGGSLLLALEVLVAADLLRTVAVAPTIDNVLVLGLIVVIRTFLSFSLEIEIEGVPPWRRAMASGAGTVRKASQAALGHRSPPDELRGPPSCYASRRTSTTAPRTSISAVYPQRMRNLFRRRTGRGQVRLRLGHHIPDLAGTRRVPPKPRLRLA